jgi:hypothetical protein
MSFIEKIKTKIENDDAWRRLEWQLDSYRDIYVNYISPVGEKENMILRGNGKYGLDINEVKIAISDLRSIGEQVNISVVEDGKVCGGVSIKKKTGIKY